MGASASVPKAFGFSEVVARAVGDSGDVRRQRAYATELRSTFLGATTLYEMWQCVARSAC